MIDGPRLPPANGGPARKLVVFLHGYGADGNDLIDLGRMFAPILPDTAFVSPHAPDPCDQAPMGRQWFPLALGDMHAYWRGVEHAAPKLQAFLDAELARLGLADRDLALVGFSQGTMMSLHTGLRRKIAPKAIVGYSGMFIMPNDGPPETVENEITARPPVLLIHGDRDELIPVQALFHASSSLQALDVPVEWHISHGIGHGIDQEGLRHGGEFLARRFGL